MNNDKESFTCIILCIGSKKKKKKDGINFNVQLIVYNL